MALNLHLSSAPSGLLSARSKTQQPDVADKMEAQEEQALALEQRAALQGVDEARRELAAEVRGSYVRWTGVQGVWPLSGPGVMLEFGVRVSVWIR